MNGPGMRRAPLGASLPAGPRDPGVSPEPLPPEPRPASPVAGGAARPGTTRPHLDALQRRFQGFVLRPETEDLADLVAETAGVPRAVRLGIYASAYRARLVEAASADYNHLHTYLGDAGFDALIRAYVEAYPPRSPSLRWLGQHLPRFLRETEPYCRHPEVVEMAELEWALCHAFDAADATPIPAALLAQVPPDAWGALALRLHPSLRQVRLRTNAPRIWEALAEGRDPPGVEVRDEPAVWLVWRHDLRLLFRQARPGEAATLACFAAGGTFAEACEGLCETLAAAAIPPAVAGFLRQWLDEGLVVGLATDR